MRAVITTLLFTLLVSASCRKNDIASGTPDCIYREIADNKGNPNWTVGSVEEYRFQNKLVYAFGPDNKIIADGATTIKTADCQSLCMVGGFGGQMINQCNGDNFFQSATLVRTIWKK
jgi:hypothetical protein